MTRHIALEASRTSATTATTPTASGRRLKKGRLYRSASHGRATDADLAAIDALDLAVIVDLRRPGERERDPSRRPAALRRPGDPERRGRGRRRRSLVDVRAQLRPLARAPSAATCCDYYRDAPFKPRHVDLFARYFQALAAGEGPVLIHCAAGKDRTGVLAALTHHVAGVHPDDIVEDYLLTNNPERIAARAPMVAAMIAQETGRTPTDAAIRAAIGVEAEYLDEAFRAIEAEPRRRSTPTWSGRWASTRRCASEIEARAAGVAATPPAAPGRRAAAAAASSGRGCRAARPSRSGPAWPG